MSRSTLATAEVLASRPPTRKPESENVAAAELVSGAGSRPAAETFILEEASHFVYDDEPERCAREVAAFLSRHN